MEPHELHVVRRVHERRPRGTVGPFPKSPRPLGRSLPDRAQRQETHVPRLREEIAGFGGRRLPRENAAGAYVQHGDAVLQFLGAGRQGARLHPRRAALAIIRCS